MNSNSNTEDQFQSLLDTVERLRCEHYPDLDEELVREILRLHAETGEINGETVRTVEQTVERHLAREL
ncbi:hypothetical protein D3C81_2089690 [compost metagenome]